MRSAKALIAVCIASLFGWCVLTMAQQEQSVDLDALLQDISTAPESGAPPAKVEATPATPEAAPAEAPPAAEAPAAVEPAPAAVETAAAPEAAAPAETPVAEAPAETPAEMPSEFPAEQPAVAEMPAEQPAAAEAVTEAVTEATAVETMAETPAVETPAELPAEAAAVEAPVAEAAAEFPAEATAPVEQPAETAQDILAPPVEEAQPAAMELPVTEEPAAVEATGEIAPAEVVTEPTAEAATVETAGEATTEAPAAVEAGAASAVAGAATEAPRKLTKKELAELEKEARVKAEQERVRRAALEEDGLKQLEAGYKDLADKKYADAIEKFNAAVAKLPERDRTQAERERAKWGLAEAQYLLAQDIYDKKGNLDEAEKQVTGSLQNNPQQRGAEQLLAKIKRQQVIAAQPLPPSKRPEVVSRENDVATLLKEGRQYFDIGDYKRAEEIFNTILVKDPYNTAAMRYLKRMDDIRFKISTREREATVADMMNKVRDAWNPPVREAGRFEEAVATRAAQETTTAAQRLQEKMGKILIPQLEFRDGNIIDVINFLVDESRRLDDPSHEGVNIILNMKIPGDAGGGAAAAAPATGMGAAAGSFDETGFSDFGTDTGAAAGAAPSGAAKTITLNLRRVSLLDAIKYITEVAGLKFRVEGTAVVITPENVVSGRVFTQMYRVPPGILDVIVESEKTEENTGRTGEFIEMGAGKTVVKTADVRDFFEKAGVPFPVGTSITYNKSISQLIVTQTQENHDKVAFILQQLQSNDISTMQVEIEARFVEVEQTVLDELGVEWMLTDDYEILTKQGKSAASAERIQMNSDKNGVTKGLRFFNYDTAKGAVTPESSVSSSTRGLTQSALGGIASFSSVLTNPEVTMILHALSQKGGSDLLSAPRVTTRNNQLATIQVVKEIIYPTEFDTTQPQFNETGNITTPPLVTPGAFQTRQTGVILNVTPIIDSGNYSIDLVLAPEVCELVDWIQYGSSIDIPRNTTAAGEVADAVTGSEVVQTFTFNIPQPVFSSRKVVTRVVVWDGETVVLGGLIREELTTVKDKIPVLGDIPVLGALFRSEGQYSQKKNLLIFVTARLVDPAGKPVNMGRNVSMPGTKGAAPSAEATATP